MSEGIKYKGYRIEVGESYDMYSGRTDWVATVHVGRARLMASNSSRSRAISEAKQLIDQRLPEEAHSEPD